MSRFTPTPNEGQPIVPGEPLKPSWPDELSSGVSLATMAELNTNLADFYTKLAAWEKARQDVDMEVALVLSWVQVANTFVSKILPVILSIAQAAMGGSISGGGSGTTTTSPLSGITGILSGLPAQIGQFQTIFNQIKSLLPAGVLPGL